eukprot:TRINITY_DN4131_c0_g2_i1.p1 TRINITY_DN4131_c0_g2~~TRINITY_DN4131_c0_g2_i1.p1  ORF type:complete len:179 (+),score=26.59 TRINITY_DN4131_c0_g2_i1:36-572(+)
MPVEYKIAVLGYGGVGKSALIVQFTQAVFDEKTYVPVIEVYNKRIKIENQKYKLEILDTVGTERYCPTRELEVQAAQGFVLVYSVTDPSAFNDIAIIREQIIREKKGDNVPMIVVGNKTDLNDKRLVTTDQGVELGRQFNLPFIETSAKTKMNVNQIFCDLVQQIDKINCHKNKCTIL